MRKRESVFPKNKMMGMSLVSTLTAAAISGILIVFVTSIVNNTFRNTLATQNDDERNSIRTLILRNLSCDVTLDPLKTNSNVVLNDKGYVNNCSGDGTVKLLQAPKNTTEFLLQGTNHDRFGLWQVSALCSTNGLEIKAQKLKPDGSCCAMDPVTTEGKSSSFFGAAKALDWNHPKAMLFKHTAGTEAIPCAEKFLYSNLCGGGILIGARGRPGSFCIDKDMQTSATYSSAQSTCNSRASGTEGVWSLCTSDQLYKGCNSGLINTPTGFYQWVNQANYSGGAAQALVMGSSSCSDSSFVAVSYSYKYRCCINYSKTEF